MTYDLTKIAELLPLCVSALVYAGAGFLVFSLLFQLAMFINCFRQPGRGLLFKSFWLIVILCWPAGPLVYGLLATNRPGSRFLAFLTMAALAGVAGILIVSPPAFARKLYNDLVPGFRSAVENTHLRFLSKENHTDVLSALRELHLEIDQPLKKRISPAVPFAVFELSRRMDESLTDQVLTDQEAASWLAAFRNRHALGWKVIDRLIRDAVARLFAQIHVQIDLERWLPHLDHMDDAELLLAEPAVTVPPPASPAPEPKQAAALADPNLRQFTLRSGKVIEGTVTYENELYYRLQTPEGTSRLVFKDDLAAN